LKAKEVDSLKIPFIGQLVLAAALAASAPASALARRGGGVPDFTRDGLPNVQSASALVIDVKDNSVLFERDADLVRPLASISKLVGALVIQTECNLKPDDLHEMTVANRDGAKGGDKSKLITGWSYSHKDLMHAALMRSDNRALPALGEACGMDTTQFGARMTERVRKLGLTKTFFKEPNGLSGENVSTAREIMIFLREVTKIPELTEILGTNEYTLVAHKNGHTREIGIHSTDRLLTKNIATIVGGKTGYTDLARYCFAVHAKTTDGREVGMVFLGAEGRHTRFADFTRVVKWLSPSAPASSPALDLKAGEPALVEGKATDQPVGKAPAPGRAAPAAALLRAAGLGSDQAQAAPAPSAPTDKPAAAATAAPTAAPAPASAPADGATPSAPTAAPADGAATPPASAPEAMDEAVQKLKW
jgi:D-alanyl-D-alanine endopeptidase (penicillin-binding protein 7)